nr:MYB transcription factor protein [Rosa persica]
MLTLENKPKRPRDDALVFIGIPEEILFEILARLPVKSLLKFRCVCKYWKTLISSPGFIDAHLERNSLKTSHDCLLIQTRERLVKKSLSLFCANTFTKFLELELPTNNLESVFLVVGSYNGVLCIHDSHHGIYLWNPSIRKFKRLPEALIDKRGIIAHGFGFHPQGNDYRVVRIWSSVHRTRTKVEVYSHRLESWRRINGFPATSHVSIVRECACVNGVVYWLMNESSPFCMSILSFDLGSEIFQKMRLPVFVPESLAGGLSEPLCYPVGIRVFEKSLSLLHERQEENDQYCDVWVLNMGSWKLSRTILLPGRGSIAWPLGFASNGRYHIVMSGEKACSRKLVLYDTKSQQVKDVRIKLNSYLGSRYIDYVRESLVLLN